MIGAVMPNNVNGADDFGGLASMMLPIQQEPVAPIQDFVPEEYRQMLIDIANENKISPRALGAMANMESNFNPYAEGPDTKWGKAQGMFQFLPSTAKGLGIDPTDPEQAARAAAKMLYDNTAKYGSLEKAFMAHHGGPNTDIWGPKTRAYGKKGISLLGMPIDNKDNNVADNSVDPRLMALLFAEMI